ncbi:MAG: hypothetical protein RR478_00840 [Bacilli bacterium]
MNELSKEIINIAGNDYTLFLNRKGIIAFEKFSKSENAKVKELEKKYNQLTSSAENIEITESTNPFDGLEEADDIDNDMDLVEKLQIKLYWILLYTNHQLSIEQVEALFKIAKEEYGLESLISLGGQMIEDINTNKNDGQELKKLSALRPKKK